MATPVSPAVEEKKKSADVLVDAISTASEKASIAAPYGLRRRLKNRHAQMIAIGGVIGTGLFLGTAGSLSQGGPGGLLLGYLVVASVCFCVMTCLGEMVTYLPIAGGYITLATRCVDPALGFAIGWSNCYSGCIAIPAEIAAVAILVNYWTSDINNAVWITICLVRIPKFRASLY